MKTSISPIQYLVAFLYLIPSGIASAQFNPIQLDQSLNQNSCELAGAQIQISVPSEVLSGDNIALNITLPGSYGQDCIKSVKIQPSQNLQFVSSSAIPFSLVNGVYENDNSSPLFGNVGHNFNVFFRFPNLVTCNEEMGSFTVTFSLDCNGQEVTCSSKVNVKARVGNYWTVRKEYIGGNLTCGTSQWRIFVENDNPNPNGLGGYNINGIISESSQLAVPVIGGATRVINSNGGDFAFTVILQNCQSEGSIIANIADYELTLGNGCETMNGSVQAQSDPLVSPNASLSFRKIVQDNNSYSTNNAFFNIAPGCEGMFRIFLQNNGNVPWTNIQIVDDLNIPGLTITNISPTTWTVTNNNGIYTFEPPSNFVLDPFQQIDVRISFQVDQTLPTGTQICNTATVSLQSFDLNQGSGGQGTTNNDCPGISCPSIDTAIQNQQTNVCFVIGDLEPLASIRKCIKTPAGIPQPPIYQVGDLIEFSIMIGNSGSGDLSTTLSDALLTSNQNLEIIPSSIVYEYYPNQLRFYRNSCSPPFLSTVSPITPPFTITPNTSQNPTWSIISMPGVCDMNMSNFLFVRFQAKVLPQLFGNKVNTARIPHLLNPNSVHASSVTYSVDQTGILSVHKIADTNQVGVGQTFNYDITVSNQGSIPLSNIVITDMLPDCITQNDPLTITDAHGSPITFTTSGNLIITIDPTTELVPGNDFHIRIPAVKSEGGDCCNISAIVNATMTTSGTELMASYGNDEIPAACISEPECCSIPDFEVSLKEQDGKFIVSLNGGNNLIKEVEISMLDYHVNYSQEDCKPDDMGLIGTMKASTINLDGLKLNSSDNGSSSLWWKLGQPAMVQSDIMLKVNYPKLRQIDCCDLNFSFCIKVKIVDVDCNVCEKMLCYSTQQDQAKCEIEMNTLKESYCLGDMIDIEWKSTADDGDITIELLDSNGAVHHTIANNQTAQGSLEYKIPSSLGCQVGKSWSINISDTEKSCFTKSDPITLKCCNLQLRCGCRRQKSQFIEISSTDSFKNLKVNTGEKITLRLDETYTLTATSFPCKQKSCDAKYQWDLQSEDNSNGTESFGERTTINFESKGEYQLELSTLCGTDSCKPCIIYILIE